VSTIGVVAVCASVSGVKLAAWPVAGADGVKLNPALDDAVTPGLASVPGWRPALAGRSVRVATLRAVSPAGCVGCAGAVAVLSAASCGAAVGGVSARRVTVPLIEKSRSCAGPMASWAAGGGGAMEIGTLSDAPSSCAKAGAAKPIASAMAAVPTRNPDFILTRLSGWRRPHRERRLRRFAVQSPALQAYGR